MVFEVRAIRPSVIKQTQTQTQNKTKTNTSCLNADSPLALNPGQCRQKSPILQINC